MEIVMQALTLIQIKNQSRLFINLSEQDCSYQGEALKVPTAF